MYSLGREPLREAFIGPCGHHSSSYGCELSARIPATPILGETPDLQKYPAHSSYLFISSSFSPPRHLEGPYLDKTASLPKAISVYFSLWPNILIGLILRPPLPLLFEQSLASPPYLKKIKRTIMFQSSDLRETTQRTLEPNHGCSLTLILLYHQEILGCMPLGSRDGGLLGTPLSGMPTLSRCTDMSLINT